MQGNEALILFIVIFMVTGSFGFYIFLMIFYPEWIGITGKSAQQTLSEHKEGSAVDDSDFFENSNN